MDMEQSFGTWLKRKKDRFDLTCFFEELELPAVGMVTTTSTMPLNVVECGHTLTSVCQVVKEDSAMIGGWPCLPIHANHKVSLWAVRNS
jgi:hypothetical protein